MTAALRNYRVWRERNGGEHERLETEHPEEDAEPVPDSQVEAENTETPPALTDSGDEEDLEEVSLAREEEASENAATTEEEDTGEQSRRTRRTVTLVELEEERELARRRTSACVLLAVFVLFRLWIQAIGTGDFGMLLLCLICTSWTARYIRYNREQEEELDRRIAAYWNAEGTDGDVAEMPRSDLRMMSFQAQLALAIMESQRQMMQGGHGHPDGENQRDPGVSEEARQRWERYKHMGSGLTPDDANGSYGSVAQEDVEKGIEAELPQCSICLCEYEDGENIVRLPCNHVYHEDCVMSWTSSHVRCPLCNFDLESATASTTVSSLPEDSIV